MGAPWRLRMGASPPDHPGPEAALHLAARANLPRAHRPGGSRPGDGSSAGALEPLAEPWPAPARRAVHAPPPSRPSDDALMGLAGGVYYWATLRAATPAAHPAGQGLQTPQGTGTWSFPRASLPAVSHGLQPEGSRSAFTPPCLAPGLPTTPGAPPPWALHAWRYAWTTSLRSQRGAPGLRPRPPPQGVPPGEPP